MRLGIGTAQFGLDYGVSNTNGRIPADEISRILGRAAELGMQDIDTAAGYGESERALGGASISQLDFRVITKTAVIHPQPMDDAAVDRVVEVFHRSLERLRLPAVYALLVHRADDLLSAGRQKLWDALEKLRRAGLCQRLGVSLARVSEIECIQREFPVEIVQVAINAFDQRWPRSGWLARLRETGVEVHVRSVFLQGLLLMDLHRLPRYFAPWRQHLSAYADFQAERRWSALDSAVRFIRTVRDVDCVVFGAESVGQIEEIHAAWQRAGNSDAGVFERFAVDDEYLVNPACWKISR